MQSLIKLRLERVGIHENPITSADITANSIENVNISLRYVLFSARLCDLLKKIQGPFGEKFISLEKVSVCDVIFAKRIICLPMTNQFTIRFFYILLTRKNQF